MDALAGAYVELAALAGERLRLVGPHTGGVDDLLGEDVELLARLEVLDLGAGDPIALAQQPDDTGAARDVRSVRRGRARQEHRVAGVVDLAVVVVERADQRFLLEPRHHPQRAATGQVTVVRHAARPARQQRHRVVEQHAGAGVDALPEATGQRVEERHRVHEVRCELVEQQAALAECLGDEPEVEHLEVAQAAVDQLAGATRRTGGEVAGVDESDRQSTGRGVERGTTADHAGTDDEDVERLRGHGVERCLAIGG